MGRPCIPSGNWGRSAGTCSALLYKRGRGVFTVVWVNAGSGKKFTEQGEGRIQRTEQTLGCPSQPLSVRASPKR